MKTGSAVRLVAVKPEASRAALNSRRYRKRKAKGQGVYLLTANKEHLIDVLVVEGYLPDNTIHDRAAIELALAHWVDDQ